MAATGVPGGRVRITEEPVLQAGHGVQQQPQAGQQQDGDDNHAGAPSGGRLLPAARLGAGDGRS
jgi:hypothetical protein